MPNRINNIKLIRNKLRNNKVTIGTWMQIPSSSVAEILSHANYDWIAIDLEHGSINTSQLPDIFRALELNNTLPLVRIADPKPKDCKLSLDAGAGGVIIPMVEDPILLEELINSCCWPPVGKRGVGFSRANIYGKYFEDYKQEAYNPLIVAMIESVNAILNLEKIVKVSGLDAILIGPYDLSASLGITGDFNNPLFIETLNKIKRICTKNNMPFGVHIVNPNKSELLLKIEEGYQFIPYSIDTVFLNSSSINPISQ